MGFMLRFGDVNRPICGVYGLGWTLFDVDVLG